MIHATCEKCGAITVFPKGKANPHKCRKKIAGMGDVVERSIKLITVGRVKPCEGCRKRRDRLNRWWSFR